MDVVEMTKIRKVTPIRIGLRAYDISIGFRNIDERNAALTDFSHTHISGMAALLAGAIKGKEIISEAQALKRIAADFLKINPWAFDKVVMELAQLEIVRDIKYSGGEIKSFSEQVPLVHDNVHELLGKSWLDKHPSELEEQLLSTVDTLAQTPVLTTDLHSEIGTDRRTEKVLRAIGTQAELIRYYSLRDGTEIATSPLYAFEQPHLLINLFEHHSTDHVREAFGRIREHPGYPIIMNNSDPIAEEIVSLGLVPAPTVVGADQQKRAFAIILYGLDPVYPTSKKQILERALALIACVRCGEVSGGATHINFPDALLAKLMDKNRNYTLKAHSSTVRQYAPLIRWGMIKPIPVGNLFAARLIPTDDNREAVKLARILLQRQGEGIPERGNEHEAAKLLFTGDNYLTPLETLGLAPRKGPSLTGSEVGDLWDQAVGRKW
jgi:hypothetical protein